MASLTQADAPAPQELSPQAKLAKSLLENGLVAFDPSSTKSSDEIQNARAEFWSLVDG